jgi:hypothetical protein
MERMTLCACAALFAVGCSTVDEYVTVDASADDGEVRDATRKDAGLAAPDAPANLVTGAAKLSETGLYSDFASRTIDPRWMIVSPRYPLWSDGDTKSRYLYLPPGAKIDTSDPDNWKFPVGTKMWKEFRVGNLLVETRLIEKVKDGVGADVWWKTAYAWKADGSDALATVGDVANALGTAHEIPGQQKCLICHGNVADAVIGLGVIQLSGTGLIGKLAADDRFTAPVVESEVPGSGDVKAALGYMHGNCGHCHNDVGWVHEVTALRLRVLLAAQKPTECGAYGAIYLASQHVLVSDAGIALRYEIVPGVPGESQLFDRISRRDVLQMPPICTKVVDDPGVALVRSWIMSLPSIETKPSPISR